MGSGSDSTPQALVPPQALLGAANGIHGATLQPDCWQRVLRVVAPCVGVTKALYLHVDRVVPSESVTDAIGLPADLLQTLRNRDIDQDFIWRASLTLPEGAVFRSTELVPVNVLHTGPLYEQIAVPAGLDYVLGAVLENTPAYFTSVTFLQAAVDFTDQAKVTLAALVPALCNAVQISRRVALGDAGRREALLSFDRARQAVAVLDRSGYVIYSNHAAGELLRDADGLAVKFGRFIFEDLALQGEFERVLRLAVTANGADIAPLPREVRVPRSRGGPPYGLSIIPVARSSDRALLPDGAGCMVLIHDLAGLNPLPLQRLSWLYGLTPAELRICESLYQFGSVEATADKLSLTRNTVRSHLKNIYGKFGVATQGQLMQRLANSVRLTEGPAVRRS